jgi:hypothetical protein
MKIVVTGLLAQYPFGGVTWDYIQYLLGFRALGHEVWYLEDSGVWPYDPVDQTYTEDCSRNVAALAQIMADFDLADRWIYRNGANGQFYGLGDSVARELLAHADVVANVSGAALLQDYELGSSHLMFLDGDPMFTQLGLVDETKPDYAANLRRYHSHFSFGLNIGQPDCLVPTGGIVWRPTVQPISLAHWPVAPQPPQRGYTTVMNWASYAPKAWQGHIYGQKDLEFQKFLDLPKYSPVTFELAMGQGPGRTRPTEKLRELGWTILEPDEIVPDYRRYHDFISDSRAEWSVAKHGYVQSRSGWFSCRTACYLAAGRPAVVQDTGWSRYLPDEGGVLPFRSIEECVAQIERIEKDYSQHQRLARALAEERFSAEKVCAALLRDAGL